MEKIIAVILVTLGLLSTPVLADEIRLNNGDQLTGNIVELDETVLRMVTQSGEILIPRDTVVSAVLSSANYTTASREVNTLTNHSGNLRSVYGMDLSENGMEVSGDWIAEE